MTTFYRIENKYKQGPYRSENLDLFSRSVGLVAASLCHNSWTHTPPDIDFTKFCLLAPSPDKDDYSFGFKNINQIYRWFNTIQSILFFEKHGFYIAKYSIDYKNIETSDSQVIYKKGKEVFIEKVPFSYDSVDRKDNYCGFTTEQIKYFYKLGL